MLKRKLIDLGKLTPEKKQEMWETSISGSQAWMLVHEPYNLIRDKLGVKRKHKSKYDFFNSNKGKAIGTSAMTQGTLYEPTVFEELNDHYKDTPLTYIDHTYKLELQDANGNPYDYINITCTPDYTLSQDNQYILIGDIKCSTSAENEQEIMERYFWQMLHNAYVLNMCQAYEIAAKNCVTRPINRYQGTFREGDFQEWENRLVEFFNALYTKDEEAYDHLYIEKKTTQLNGKDIKIKALVEYEAQPAEAEKLYELARLKELLKDTKAQIDMIENDYKEKYDNLAISFDGHILNMSAIEQRGTIDYTKAIKELSTKYNFPATDFDAYRKPASLRKTIKLQW